MEPIGGIKVDKIRTYSWGKQLSDDADGKYANFTKISMIMNENNEIFKRKFGKLD